MGQLLRLHFENKDYTFRILNTESTSRETTAIELLFEGQSLKLIKQGNVWIAETSIEGINNDLINAITRNIALRFRL